NEPALQGQLATAARSRPDRVAAWSEARFGLRRIQARRDVYEVDSGSPVGIEQPSYWSSHSAERDGIVARTPRLFRLRGLFPGAGKPQLLALPQHQNHP